MIKLNKKLVLDLETLEPRTMLSTVQVIGGGSEGGEVLELLVDDVQVESWVVSEGADAGQYNTYTWNTNDNVTADQVRVQFSNDQYDPNLAIDRNLRIDAIVIDGQRFETEAPSVYSTGTWLPEDGLQPGFRQSEYLTSNGYFQYADTSSSSVVEVRARGSEGTEEFNLIVNGTVLQTFQVSTSFQTFSANAAGSIDPAQVRIEFINDQWDPANNVDANLFVDYISIDSAVYQTEAPTTWSTGTWQPADGLTPGFRQSEELTNNGYFQYLANPNGSSIEVRARGTEGTEQFNLLVGGNVVGTWTASQTDQTFFYQSNQTLSIDQLRIEFTNDQWDPVNNVDSNLIVDFVVLDGTTWQTESALVYSTGTWATGEGIAPGYGRGDTLHGNGYFQYQSAVPNTPFDLNGQTVYQRDGHLYLLTSSTGSWANALSESTSLGGSLVSINDASEDSWLTQTFGNSLFWTGLNDLDQEGTFSWVNGDPLIYTNWAAGEPNNGAGTIEQDFGVTNYQGGWDDQDSSHSHFGIIEIGSGGNGPTQNGLLAEYYNGVNFDNLVATQVDPNVNFDWGSGGPDAAVRSDSFSIRWSGQIESTIGGLYQFRTISDDGVRLYVDNQLIINEWNDHSATEHTGSINLLANQRFDIRMEYYENGGAAVAQLEWAVPGGTFESIPTSQLFAAESVSSNPNGTGFVTETIAEGLNQPIAFAVAPDGRIFVTEKEGRVKIVENGQVVSTFIDINLEVQSGHDRGLMGIALDPDFENTGHVYLNFSEEINPGNPDDNSSGSDAAGRLIRVSASTTNPNVADLSTRVDVLTGHVMTHYTHSVGDVDFDNQGNLIFTWGDGGFDPQLRLEAQNENSKQGKLYRLNRFTFEGVPENPFFDASDPASTASKVWAVGVRNSWKMTVDRQTGDVWMGEVTDGGPEEINVMRADGSTVLNYGWPYYEDNIRTSYGNVPSNFVYERAFVGLPHTNAGGGDSIVGGAVYRGTNYSDVYEGRLFFANFNQGILYTADSVNGGYQQFGTAGQYTGVVDIQMGPDGHIWMMNLLTGKIERLVDANTGSNNADPQAKGTANQTAGAGPVVVTFDAFGSSDPDGDALNYAWDFDSDGVIDAGGETAVFTYQQLGRNTATLIVFDGQGSADFMVFEIDVLADADGNNLAIGRPVTHSLTNEPFIGSRTVDGLIAGSDTYSQTLRQRTPLWEVDLGSVQQISEVEIHIPAGSELSDFWVLVSSNPFSSGNLDASRNDPGVLAYQVPDSVVNQQLNLNIGADGRFVRVQRAGQNEVLTLSEVRVLG